MFKSVCVIVTTVATIRYDYDELIFQIFNQSFAKKKLYEKNLKEKSILFKKLSYQQMCQVNLDINLLVKIAEIDKLPCDNKICNTVYY